MVKDLDNIKDLVKTFDYVSFDIFDTLMFRTVPHYTDLYSLIQLKYEESFELLNADFKKDRIAAEAKARRSRYPAEVTLDYIYSFLPYHAQVVESLKKIEVDCEIACCMPNLLMIELLKWCRSQNKRVVIITDMYHCRDTLNAILKKIGVIYDRLFISCEEGVTKRSGELFKVVLRDLDISAEQIIHTGDDPNNDILMPKSIGIKAFERVADVLPYGKSSDKEPLVNHLHSLYCASCSLEDSENSLKKFAFCRLGPMCIDFCQWVHFQVERLNIERVLFVAREGFLLKLCYDILYPEDSRNVKYVRLNKNLLRLPLLNSKNPVDEFLRSVPSRITLGWEEILRNFFVEDIVGYKKKIESEFPELNVDDWFSQEVLKSDSLERRVLLYLIDLQKDNVADQYRLLDEYLYDIGVYGNRVALVNNSINGSGQSMIEQYVMKNGKKCDIVGLQFVKSSLCSKRLADRCHAWISDSSLPQSYTYYYGYGNLILEHLLFESVGTAMIFSRKEGKVDVVCECQRSEKKNNDLISKLQQLVLDFAKRYKNNLNMSLNYTGARLFKKWMAMPDKESAMLFCELFDDDNDGEKKLADLSIEIPDYVALKRYVPNQIKWYPGYFIAKGKGKIWLWLYNLRYVLKYKLKKF